MSKSQSPTQMVEVNGLQCVERGGEFWFTATAIGTALGYSDPGRSVRTLYQRHVQYLQEHKGGINMMTPGGVQETTVFDEVGTYYLIMKSETDRASEISLKFARALKELRRQKLAEQEQRIKALESAQRAQVAGLLALGEERRELMLRVVRYAELGLVRWEIKRLTGLHKDTVRKLLREAEVLGLVRGVGRGAGNKGLDLAARQRILELRGTGLSYAAIAAQVGCTKEAVRGVLRREGAPRGGGQ